MDTTPVFVITNVTDKVVLVLAICPIMVPALVPVRTPHIIKVLHVLVIYCAMDMLPVLVI